MSGRSFSLNKSFISIFFFCKVLRNLIARVQYCNAICGMEFSKNGKKMFKSSVFINFLKVVSMFKKRCVATSLNWAFFQNLACKYFYGRFWIIASIMLFHSFFHVFQLNYFNLRWNQTLSQVHAIIKLKAYLYDINSFFSLKYFNYQPKN